MKVKYLVREENLNRIAVQADLLAKRARKLVQRYREHEDAGIFPPTEAVHDAERDLSSAFMAVIRVTAAFYDSPRV